MEGTSAFLRADGKTNISSTRVSYKDLKHKYNSKRLDMLHDEKERPVRPGSDDIFVLSPSKTYTLLPIDKNWSDHDDGIEGVVKAWRWRTHGYAKKHFRNKKGVVVLGRAKGRSVVVVDMGYTTVDAKNEANDLVRRHDLDNRNGVLLKLLEAREKDVQRIRTLLRRKYRPDVEVDLEETFATSCTIEEDSSSSKLKLLITS